MNMRMRLVISLIVGVPYLAFSACSRAHSSSAGKWLKCTETQDGLGSDLKTFYVLVEFNKRSMELFHPDAGAPYQTYTKVSFNEDTIQGIAILSPDGNIPALRSILNISRKEGSFRNVMINDANNHYIADEGNCEVSRFPPPGFSRPNKF